jgi:hypothetical protein
MTDERSPPGPGGAYVTLDTLDVLAELLACRLHVWAQSLAPKRRRGRTPNDLRAALARVAAFEVAESLQLRERGSSVKYVSLAALGFSKSGDKDNGGSALNAARQKIERLLPEMTWTGVSLPGDPPDSDLELLKRLSPELAKRGLAAIWMTGNGAPPRLGETWTGRAVAVFLPVGFKPREKGDRAVMHVEDIERLEL